MILKDQFVRNTNLQKKAHPHVFLQGRFRPTCVAKSLQQFRVHSKKQVSFPADIHSTKESLTRGMCDTSSYVTPDLVMISWQKENKLKFTP